MNIIFDLDGTLLDVSRRYCEIYLDLLREHGYPTLPAERYWQLRRARVPIHNILHETGAAGAAETFQREHLRKVEERRYLALDDSIAGVMPMLDTLKKHSRLALVTLRRCRENLIWQLERLRLSHYFDRVLSEPSEREDWQTKQKMVASLGIESSRALLIGDTEADVLAGAHLNLATCAVAYGMRTGEYLEQLCPTYLVTRPEDLCPMVLMHINGG